MTEDKKTTRAKVSDGIKQGIGVLSAFKDALEETIQEAKDRGDLSTERAKEVMKDALHKAQDVAEGAKDHLDLVTQKDFDTLRDAVDVIKEKVSALEAGLRGDDAGAAKEGEPDGENGADNEGKASPGD